MEPAKSGRGATVTPAIRIVFCITELDPGGAERALTQLVLNLERDEWEPHVVCLGPRGHFAEVLESAGVPVHCLNATGVFSLPRVLFQLTREIRRLQPAVVQTFLFHANILGRIAAKLAGVKVVVSGLRVAERRNSWHGRIDRWTNGLVVSNVCVSQGVAEFSQRVTGLDPAKLVVIPNSVDSDRFAGAPAADLSLFDIPKGSKVFISVGRLDRQKGFDILIDAVSLLNPLPSDVYFLIVGDGPDFEKLRLQIAQSKLTRQIRLAGRREDVPQLLEAMAAGLPVIATQVEGISELVQHGITGLVVASEKPVELKSAINHLLTHPDFIAAAAKNSETLVKKEFTTKASTDAYCNLYRQWLELQPKSPR